MTTEKRLLLELSAAVARLLRDYDSQQFPPDKTWTEHQRHAERLDLLAADLENGTDIAEGKIAERDRVWERK